MTQSLDAEYRTPALKRPKRKTSWEGLFSSPRSLGQCTWPVSTTLNTILPTGAGPGSLGRRAPGTYPRSGRSLIGGAAVVAVAVAVAEARAERWDQRAEYARTRRGGRARLLATARVTRPLPPATFRPTWPGACVQRWSLQAMSGPDPYATLTSSRPRGCQPREAPRSLRRICPVPGRRVQGADLQVNALPVSLEHTPERTSRTVQISGRHPTTSIPRARLFFFFSSSLH